MTRVKVKNSWEHDAQAREVELSEILTPHPYDASGELEHMQECIRANARALGRLLAHLVERKRLTLRKALEIVERSNLEVVK